MWQNSSPHRYLKTKKKITGIGFRGKELLFYVPLMNPSHKKTTYKLYL
jgi:hypothetical protein